MKSVVFYGNCQSTILAKMFRARCEKDISIVTIYNDLKSGYVPSNEVIEKHMPTLYKIKDDIKILRKSN